MRGKGKGVERVGGWGGDRRRNRQVDAQAFVQTTLYQGKKKHININKSAGLSRDWVGANNLFMCVFFLGSFLMGEKKHINKIRPKIPGQSRENLVYEKAEYDQKIRRSRWLPFSNLPDFFSSAWGSGRGSSRLLEGEVRFW